MKMKNTKKLVLIPALVIGINSFANAAPCDGQPQVICRNALKKSESLAERNFREYGRDKRRIFRGHLHTIDSDGTEHSGPAMGKNVWDEGQDHHFQGTLDKKLFATLETSYWGPSNGDPTFFDPEFMHLNFATIVKGDFGFKSINFNDPRLKAHLERVGDLNRWTFRNLEAENIPTGIGNSGSLKHIEMKAILPVTLNDLIEASEVYSYRYQHYFDLDLKKALLAGDLMIGPTSAVLKTKEHLLLSRTDLAKPFFLFGESIPNAEIPAECLTSDRAHVDYETTLDIPLNHLIGTVVTGVKIRVSCTPSGLHMGRIQSITAATPIEGKIEVNVNYLRACNETFEILINRDQGDRVLAVGVVMSTGAACIGPDILETTTFSVRQLPKNGVYHFENISSRSFETKFSPAFIESITQAEPLGGKIQVPYTSMLGCSERSFAGDHIIFPLKSGNGRYGLLNIAEKLGGQCSNPPRRSWDYFEVPEIPGGYSFVPVE